MPRIDTLLASVIKGAQEAGASVEQLTIGREEKLAGVGGAAGSLAGPLGSAAGAGLQDKNWGSAAGAGAGALLGGAAGTALGGIAGCSIGQLIDADPHLSQTVGSILGMLGGGALGGHLGQNALRPAKQAGIDPEMLARLGVGAGMGALGGAVASGEDHRLRGALAGAAGGGALVALGEHPSIRSGLGSAAMRMPNAAIPPFMAAHSVLPMAAGALAGHVAAPEEEGLLGKFSSAEDAYLAGSAEAVSRFKVAFLPLLGAIAGPLLGRAALGRVAGGAIGKMGGGAVGRMAGGMAKSKGIGGAAVDMGASMAGQQLMS